MHAHNVDMEQQFFIMWVCCSINETACMVEVVAQDFIFHNPWSQMVSLFIGTHFVSRWFQPPPYGGEFLYIKTTIYFTFFIFGIMMKFSNMLLNYRVYFKFKSRVIICEVLSSLGVFAYVLNYNCLQFDYPHFHVNFI